MQLGLVSAILPDLTLTEVMKFAKEIGYDCVELMCWPLGKAERRYAGVTHIDVNHFGKPEADEVFRLVEETGISISGLGYYPNPLSADDEEAKVATSHILKVIDACVSLDVSVMNTFIGRNQFQSIDDNWQRFLTTWRPIIQYAEERDVKIAIENCPMLFTADEWPGGKNLMTTPRIWERAFNDIQSDHFGLNFDPSHFIWQFMDYADAIDRFAEKFFHVHAKDATLDHDRIADIGIMAFPNDYHTPRLPGLGDVDWDVFFSALVRCGYNGAVCVEVEDREFEDTLQKRKEALILSFEHLRKHF